MRGLGKLPEAILELCFSEYAGAIWAIKDPEEFQEEGTEVVHITADGDMYVQEPEIYLKGNREPLNNVNWRVTRSFRKIILAGK